MAPLVGILDPFHRRTHQHNGGFADVSSSHSTFSANPSSKGPISPPSPREDSSRRVSFESQVQVFNTMDRSAYTIEEKKNTWLTFHEFEGLKSDRKHCVRVMEKVNAQIDDGQHYFRGLESKTKDGYKRKRFNVVDANMTVMEEQFHQHRRGIMDWNAISSAYITCTQASGEEARTRALFDELAALLDSAPRLMCT